jgi:hypothetical protein
MIIRARHKGIIRMRQVSHCYFTSSPGENRCLRLLDESSNCVVTRFGNLYPETLSKQSNINRGLVLVKQRHKTHWDKAGDSCFQNWNFSPQVGRTDHTMSLDAQERG